MSVSEICSRLKQPGLPLSEMCMLINALGDHLTFEMFEEGRVLSRIKSGWNQLIEILQQTTHPTVRQVAFQNIKYVLSNRTETLKNAQLNLELLGGLNRLLAHWNTNIQIQAMDIIFQDASPFGDRGLPLGTPCVFSSLANSDYEAFSCVMSLFVQYDNCHLYFVVLKMLSSMRNSIRNVRSKELVKAIIEQVCNLGKNLDLEELTEESVRGPDFARECLQTSKSYRKREFLVIIFDILGNVSNRFQDMKVLGYRMVKDEIALLLSESLLPVLDYRPYLALVEKGLSVMTRTALLVPIISTEYVKFLRTTWNQILAKASPLGEEGGSPAYAKNDGAILSVLSQVIKSLLTIYLRKGLILFLWDFELGRSGKPEVDGREPTDEAVFIISLDHVTQQLTQFIQGLREEEERFCSQDGVCEYVSTLSTIVDIGLDLHQATEPRAPQRRNWELIAGLVLQVLPLLSRVRSHERFLPLEEGRSGRLLESYFVLNYLLCKAHYLLVLSGQEERLGPAERSQIQELSSGFVEWVISKGAPLPHRDRLHQVCRELTLKLIYFGLAPSRSVKLARDGRIGLVPGTNPEITFLTILRNLCRFALPNDGQGTPGRAPASQLLSNFYFCCLYFHRLGLPGAEGELLHRQVEEALLASVPSLEITDRYKYAKYFALIGQFKVAKAIFESIKLYTIGTRAWIKSLVAISHAFGHLQSFLRTERAPDAQAGCLPVRKLLRTLKYALKDAASHLKFVRRPNATFFSDLYVSALLRITEFLSICFNSKFNAEPDATHPLDLLRVLAHLVKLLKTLFGLANMVKLASVHSFHIIASIYWSVRQVALKVVLSRVLSLADSAKPDAPAQAVSNLALIQQTLLSALNQGTPTFNTLVEKSLVDNLLPIFQLADLNSLSQFKWELIRRQVSSQSLATLYLRNAKRHPGDLLVSTLKNPRKPNEKTSFSLTYLRQLPLSSTPSSEPTPDCPHPLPTLIDSPLSLQNACMHILASVGKFPPSLLTPKMLPHVHTACKLLGFQNDQDCLPPNIDTVSSNLPVTQVSASDPVLKLCGVFKNALKTNFSRKLFWVRVKLVYELNGGDELTASHLLDISVTKASFTWSQPIERAWNVRTVKILVFPLNQFKICIGTPFTTYINVS